jgi:hypothetical protein
VHLSKIKTPPFAKNGVLEQNLFFSAFFWFLGFFSARIIAFGHIVLLITV